jgi:hypothetical protein
MKGHEKASRLLSKRQTSRARLGLAIKARIKVSKINALNPVYHALSTLHDPTEEFQRIHTDGPGDIDEFEHVYPVLLRFHLPHETARALQFRRQGALA